MGELRVEHLSKAFAVGRGIAGAALHVFHDISLTIGNGAFVSVIGPSGCGKSTLLSLVAGLDRATAGTVYVDGRRVTGPGMDRGVVFQEFALFPWLSVLDNVAFGLRSMGVGATERRRRAMEYVKLVGLEPFAAYHPNRLSGGMRQRVGIGRALAIEPEILLMDEPFGALDAQTRESMQNALSEIWAQARKTVMFITHDIREAVFLSDRVIVLGGRPAAIVLDLRIDLARPRARQSPQFQIYEGQLEQALRAPTDGRDDTP